MKRRAATLTVPLHTLPIGTTFRMPYNGRTGTVNLANECRASVTYQGDAETRATTLDITPNVLVERVEASQ